MRGIPAMGSRRWFAVWLPIMVAVGGCSQTSARPADVDTRYDACARCRMVVSNVHFAAQLAAPREEPVFFDDIGCLRDFLASRPRLPPATVAYVADHRTGAWVRAAQAVFTRADALDTPMGSHLMAHADAASRDADSAAGGGVFLTARAIFRPNGPPDGRP
jgi:copper chaperone NosL